MTLALSRPLRQPRGPEAQSRPGLDCPPPEHERAAARTGLHWQDVEQVRCYFVLLYLCLLAERIPSNA